MKVLLDANVLISYLLSREGERTVTLVVRTCLLGGATLVVPQELLAEISRTVQRKPYLRERIRPEELALLAEQLMAIGEAPARLDTLPSFSRDRHDDYLVAYGIIGKVDYLVTGDPDLLVLGTVDTLHIVTPAQFLTIVEGG